MAPVDQDQEPQVSEGHGLRVTWSENEPSLTLSWDPETHPEYNYFADFSEDELIEHLFGHLREPLDELENTPTTRNNDN